MKAFEIRVANTWNIKKQRRDFLKSLIGHSGNDFNGDITKFCKKMGYCDEFHPETFDRLGIDYDVRKRYLSPLTMLSGAICPCPSADGLLRMVIHQGVVNVADPVLNYDMEIVTKEFIKYLGNKYKDLSIIETQIPYTLDPITMMEKYFISNIALSDRFPNDLIFPSTVQPSIQEYMDLKENLNLYTDDKLEFSCYHIDYDEKIKYAIHVKSVS